MEVKLSSKAQEQVKTIKTTLKKLGKDSASIEEIKGALTIPIAHHTLQRRLEQMQRQGSVTITGGRSNKKFLVSILNDRVIVIHDSTSASQQTVPKYHRQAKELIFGQLKGTYSELPISIETLRP